MVDKKLVPVAPAAGQGKVIAETGDSELVMRGKGDDTGRKPQKAGDKGPPSSLETGIGSPTGASAGGNTNYEGRRDGSDKKGAIMYSVQKHDDENGVQVEYVSAESGDEAAQKVLAAAKYKGTSIRGVTPASDPDPNSLGGERDASVMIHNAENPAGEPASASAMEANRKATEGLGKADIKELGE